MDLPKWYTVTGEVAQETWEKARTPLTALADIATLWGGPAVYLLSREKPDYPAPLLECATDALGGLNLAMQGYYKYAATILRQQLELGLMGVLLKYSPDDQKSYDRKRTMPKFRLELLRVLDSWRFPAYRRLIRERDLSELMIDIDSSEIQEMFHILSSAVHSHVGTWNVVDWGGDGPFPSFSQASFDRWAGMYALVQRRALLWSVLGFPGMYQWIIRESGLPKDWTLVFDQRELDFLESLPLTIRL